MSKNKPASKKRGKATTQLDPDYKDHLLNTEEGDPMCHCGHPKSLHFLSQASCKIDDGRGCNCLAFHIR